MPRSTMSLKTTTTYAPLIFYPWTGECLHCVDSSLTLSADVSEAILKYTEIFTEVVTDISLVLNSVHFFILTRKELRRNTVFFIMIAICVCDMLALFSCMLEYLFKDYEARPDVNCFRDNSKQWWIKGMLWYSEGIQKFGRLCAAVLALAMTFLRTFSVMYPMNSLANTMAKLKSAFFITSICIFICGAWYAQFYLSGSLIAGVGTGCYFHSSTRDSAFFTTCEGYITLIINITYLILTIVFIVALKKVKNRRKNLRTDKPDNTLNLVVAMSTSYLIAGFAYSAVFLAMDGPFEMDNAWMWFRIQLLFMLRQLPKGLLAVHSFAHAFICFSMSSQYRETVLRFFQKKKHDVVVEASKTGSRVARTLNSSQDTSKKNF